MYFQSPPSHEHAALANDILDGSFKSVHGNQSNPMYQQQVQAASNQNQGIENLDLAKGINDGASSYLTRDENAYNSFAENEHHFQVFGDAGPNIQQQETANEVVGDVAIATEKDEQVDHLLKEKMKIQKVRNWFLSYIFSHLHSNNSVY